MYELQHQAEMYSDIFYLKYSWWKFTFYWQIVIVNSNNKHYQQVVVLNSNSKHKWVNCDGDVLEIYLDHKFQWPQQVLNCKHLAYDVVT